MRVTLVVLGLLVASCGEAASGRSAERPPQAVAEAESSAPEIVLAQTPLAVSPPDQTVEDFGREWRRARKMARACGAPDAYMNFVGFSEGMLVAMKADEQRKLGKAVEDDSSKYVLGFEDHFEVTASACAEHQNAFGPIIDAISKALNEKGTMKAFRPPTVQ